MQEVVQKAVKTIIHITKMEILPYYWTQWQYIWCHQNMINPYIKNHQWSKKWQMDCPNCILPMAMLLDQKEVLYKKFIGWIFKNGCDFVFLYSVQRPIKLQLLCMKFLSWKVLIHTQMNIPNNIDVKKKIKNLALSYGLLPFVDFKNR